MRRGIVIAAVVFSLLALAIPVSCDTAQEPEAEAVIGPDGGVLEVTDPESSIYGTRIEIPPDALTDEITISVSETTFDLSVSDKCEFASFTPAILIEPDNILLSKNCTITLPYSDLDDDGFIDGTDFSERFLSVYFALSGSEEAHLANDYVVDTNANVIHVSTNHFSRWNFWGQRWNPGVTVSYYIASVPGDEDDESLFHQEIADAFLMWQTALDDTITFDITGDEDEADIVFRETNFCQWYDLLPCDVYARTTWYLWGYSPAGQFTIYFNTHPGGASTKWIADDYCDFDYSGIPFLRVALHEIGHTLGLDDLEDKKNTGCTHHTACNPTCDTDNRVIMRYDDLYLRPFIYLSCLDISEVRSHYKLQTQQCLPVPEEIVITQETDATEAIALLQADELDIFAYSVTDATLYAEVLADPDLVAKKNLGNWYEYTFNPVGPLFTATGKLNPFCLPEIRETINWLIDRDYIVGSMMGGLGVPRYTCLNHAFEAAERYPTLMADVEAYYAHTSEKLDAAWLQFEAGMLSLGCTYHGDYWWYDYGGGDEQVEVIFLIRTEDERTEMGDYLADLLEDWGLSVAEQYGTLPELSDIWLNSDPDLGLWHIYTGGWVSTVISRNEGPMLGFMYTDVLPLSPLWEAYGHDQPYFTEAEKLWSNDFTTMEERADLFETCMWGTMEDSVRVFIVTNEWFTPMQANVDVAADLAGGVYRSWMWALTVHFTDEGGSPYGGTLRVAMPGILARPWNPIGGSSRFYDTLPIRGTGDMGHHPDTRTGLRWAGRIDSAEVTCQTGLPVCVINTEWCSLDFATEITVPDDAWADWDATTQEFITVAERFPDPSDRVALTKSVSYYPLDIFETPLHDGSTLSMGDFILYTILLFDRAKPESSIYDADAVYYFDDLMSQFKGVKFITDNPSYGLVVEYYSDQWYVDAELTVTTMWPDYDGGNGFWHVLALGIGAEADGLLAFGKTKATANEVEWTDFIAGPSLPILKDQLDTFRAGIYPDNIPYPPTMGDYVDANEATERYDNLHAWYTAPEKGHFWVCSGPFYLQRAFPTEKVIHLKRFYAYPDPLDRWLFLLDEP